MLPDIRFAFGAMLAGAVLIVTAFGFAATVRMAQYRAAPPLESALAYSDPAESERRPDALRRVEELRGDAPGRDILLERLAVTPAPPIMIGRVESSGQAEREEPADRRPTEVAPLAAAIMAPPLQGEAISPVPARTAKQIVAPREMPAAPRPTEALAPQSETLAPPAVPAEALSPPTAMRADATPVALPATPAEALSSPPAMAPDATTVGVPAAPAEAAARTALEPQAAQPVVPEEAVRVASLPAPVEAAVKTSPRTTASIAAPGRKTLSKLRKKLAAARKIARVHAPRVGAWIQPTARTGYPVWTTGWSRSWPRSVSKAAKSE